jgi:GNAT superfamily N-acetyltransferase
VIRELRPEDRQAAIGLAVRQRLHGVHPCDLDVLEPTLVQRRMRRRLSSEVVGDGRGLGSFHGRELRAFVLWADGVHPLTDEVERHLLDVGCVPGDEASHLGAVVEHALERARAEGVHLVRAEIGLTGTHAGAMGEQFRALGFRSHHVVVRRRVVDRARPDGDFAFTTREHRSFALECLARGIVNAQESVGPASAEGAVRRYVRRRFRVLNSPSRISVVALEDSSPRAHALVHLVRGELHHEREALLEDVFVPPEWSGRGWSQRLSGYVEYELHRRKVTRMEGTVVEINDPNSRLVLERLVESGWWPDRRWLVQRVNRMGVGVPVR